MYTDAEYKVRLLHVDFETQDTCKVGQLPQANGEICLNFFQDGCLVDILVDTSDTFKKINCNSAELSGHASFNFTKVGHSDQL